jgi:hypothetical protein
MKRRRTSPLAGSPIAGSHRPSCAGTIGSGVSMKSPMISGLEGCPSQSQPGCESGRHWLPDMDLNHDKQIQSLLCYRYTIGQSVQRLRLGIRG